MKIALTISTYFILIFIVSSGTTKESIDPPAAKKSNSLKLFWSEEFNIDGKPDPNTWSYDIGNGPDGWGNQELEYYTDRKENAYIDNGTLKIKAIKEEYNERSFTSARLFTKGKFQFKYGRVEIRAKLPAEVGTWPAAWMLGAEFGKLPWPDCGEIDIVEHRGSELNKIVSAFHYPERHGGNCDANNTMINNATAEFHIYRMDWTEKEIKVYVDDKLFHSLQLTSSMPYRQDFYFLLNLAIGGGFGGPVDPNFKSSVYEVDYIRVYK